MVDLAIKGGEITVLDAFVIEEVSFFRFDAGIDDRDDDDALLFPLF